MDGIFSLSPHTIERVPRTLIPFMRALPYHPLKISPPNTSLWRQGFQHRNLGEGRIGKFRLQHQYKPIWKGWFRWSTGVEPRIEYSWGPGFNTQHCQQQHQNYSEMLWHSHKINHWLKHYGCYLDSSCTISTLCDFLIPGYDNSQCPRRCSVETRCHFPMLYWDSRLASASKGKMETHSQWSVCKRQLPPPTHHSHSPDATPQTL